MEKSCKAILEDNNNENTLFNIILINNNYLKPKYIKNIPKADAIITHEKPLSYSNILVKDIEYKCRKYIK